MQASRTPAAALNLYRGVLPASLAGPGHVGPRHHRPVELLHGFHHSPPSPADPSRIISSRAGSFFRKASTSSMSLAFTRSVFPSLAFR